MAEPMREEPVDVKFFNGYLADELWDLSLKHFKQGHRPDYDRLTKLALEFAEVVRLALRAARPAEPATDDATVDAHEVLCRVFDDVDAVYAEWEAFDKSGWLTESRALGAFIGRRVASREAAPTEREAFTEAEWEGLVWSLSSRAEFLAARYGAPVYLVGSALNWRERAPNDIDIRIVLPDAEWEARFGGNSLHFNADCPPAYVAEVGKMTRQLVRDLRRNIDLQVQPENWLTRHNAHDKPRLLLADCPSRPAEPSGEPVAWELDSDRDQDFAAIAITAAGRTHALATGRTIRRSLYTRPSAPVAVTEARLRSALANLLHVVETSPGALATVDAVLDAKSALRAAAPDGGGTQ